MKTLTIATLLVFMNLPAAAGTFNVSPIRVGLSPQKPTMPLSITNNSDAPVVIQVQAMQWSQENGEDVYVRTDHLLATPPIVTIPGHGTQIIRVGLRKQFDPEREMSYRIYLAEVPGLVKADGTGLQMLLRISLPAFVTGSKAAKPDLKWAVIPSGQGSGKLKVTNDGSAHALVSNMRLLDMASDQTIARQLKPAYLLPGTSREWPLQMESGKAIGSEQVRLQAYMDSGDINTDLLPEKVN